MGGSCLADETVRVLEFGDTRDREKVIKVINNNMVSFFRHGRAGPQ